MAPLFLLPMVAVLLMVTLQRAWLVTPKNLQPKLSRISLLANAKHKFGPNGLFEFLKSLVKLGLIAAVLGLFLARRLDGLVGTLQLDPKAAMAVLFASLRDFLAVVLVISLVLGGQITCGNISAIAAMRACRARICRMNTKSPRATPMSRRSGGKRPRIMR